MEGDDIKIDKALRIAFESGGIDGAHHKMWVIDQMVRALTGCPMILDSAKDCRGNTYTFERQGESEEYKRFVRRACNSGEYEWDCGIAP